MMTEPASPLLFPETLNFPALWRQLGKTHNLNAKDFTWLSHVKLATQALRSRQTPPMLAQSIHIHAGTAPSVTLAGCFILSETPDDQGAILYTPYDGIKKYESLATLKKQLEKRLKDAEEDDLLLTFIALDQRRDIVEQRQRTLTFEAIEGDIFDHQKAQILASQQRNAQTTLDELKRLPSLTSMLETLLNGLLNIRLPHINQALTRVNFYLDAALGSANAASPTQSVRHWHDSISLSDAVLMVYRNQGWPTDQMHEFSHPGRAPFDRDQAVWEEALDAVAGKLQVLLFQQLQHYWQAPAETGTPRNTFFSAVLQEQARADLMIKRESAILSADKFAVLHQMIQPDALPAGRPTIENVRIWEYQPEYVELAGSLMISHIDACLYTPTHGLQVLKDYPDLRDTVLSKFGARGHQDEFYGLLSMQERNRFIGFNRPNVTGESLGGEPFIVLCEAIITKQRQNIAYALQVFRHSDGGVDIHSLFDKALDIRAMLHERLLTLDAGERWSTRPVLTGVQQPSEVLAHKATRIADTCDLENIVLTGTFRGQPTATEAEQRRYLDTLKGRLSNVLLSGVTHEAQLRVMSGSLTVPEQAIVDTVFNNAQPSRDDRRSLNGFRPDAWSITLRSAGVVQSLALAHCFLLTERGGLDDLHSGRAVLWTPAQGLEVFASIGGARLALEHRLKDKLDRLTLLENLLPQQRRFHNEYTLGALRLIEDNVLLERVQSGIEHFLARCNQLRQRIKTASKLKAAFDVVVKTPIDTNLERSVFLANAICQQQSLPAWMGMAPVQEQQLYLELLEQWRHSVVDQQDYLSGLPSLPEYVSQRLQSLLDSRFPGSALDPQNIEITPNLALAGPARPLTEFALNHFNIGQGTGFKVASKTTRRLPAGLDQSAVRQLLLSLDIPTTFAAKITAALSPGNAQATARRQRFYRQLPWQLLQHAQGLKMQQQLSARAFDHLCQVLDMPDGLARKTVEGAHAIVSPLSLFKTAGAVAVEALGLYLIGPGGGHTGPLVLYSPYGEEVLREFVDSASVIAAINTPGSFQDLLIRRLPQAQQSIFATLLQSSAGMTSEFTLSSTPITGNVLHRFFTDNLKLLPQLLSCQLQRDAQSDWDTAKALFNRGISLSASLLPGKVSYLSFLWQAYKDFKHSAEGLQDHHWPQALKSFISGAAQMISLGRLKLDGAAPVTDVPAPPTAQAAPSWSQIRTTSPLRTELQPFEATDVALQDLRHVPQTGLYEDLLNKRTYAPIAGKVNRVDHPGPVWQMINDLAPGPSLVQSGSRLLLAPDQNAAHYGKVMSILSRADDVEANRRALLNIEAIGMKEIQRLHPYKARQIQQAIDIARFYAFNSLHNLAQLKANVPGSRLDGFLKGFFGVTAVDKNLLSKVHKAIVPICEALVDPSDDLMNTERFVVGSNIYKSSVSAFVLIKDERKMVHFTEHFFDPNLAYYQEHLSEPFNIEGHAQAATLIHEFSHQYSGTEDFALLEARRPFPDLINTITVFGRNLRDALEDFRSTALSLQTPRQALFARESHRRGEYVDLDKSPDGRHIGKEILRLTSSPTMDEARNAFYNRISADARIDIILHNADSLALLICEMGRQLDPVPAP